MSILTQKMKTARKDYVTSASRMFIPCSEGSGNSISDIIGNVVIPDDGTASWTAPHAANIILSIDSLSGGTFPSIEAGQSLVLYAFQKVVTLSAFTGITFGETAGTRYGVNNSSGFIQDEEGTLISSGGNLVVNAGQHFGAAIFLNRESNLLFKYGSVENAGFSVINSVDASTATGRIAPSSVATISLSFAQSYYAIGIAAYNTPPSEAELLAALDETYSNVLQGHKYSVSPL